MTASVSDAVRYSRLIRPYSLRRLEKALWYVETAANGITQRRVRLMTDPITDPDLWMFELEQLQNSLETLAEQCEEAWRRVDLLKRSARGDYERAVMAMTRILQGIAASGSGEDVPRLRVIPGGEAAAS